MKMRLHAPNEMTESVLGDLEQGITELQDSLRYNLAALKT